MEDNVYSQDDVDEARFGGRMDALDELRRKVQRLGNDYRGVATAAAEQVRRLVRVDAAGPLPTATAKQLIDLLRSGQDYELMARACLEVLELIEQERER